MRNILIIGAGQIGSRHLQGIAAVKEKLSISVIDPSIDSLNLSKKRFYEVQENVKKHIISFSQNLSPMENLDLVIIATSSNIRKKVFMELLEYNVPKYIIFEKFVCQNHEDFSEISSLLKKNKIKAWVNCPNRTFPSYKNIKNKLVSTKEIFVSVVGGNWGLASNSIHYLDLFSYLIDSSNIKIVSSEIDRNLYKSKREGFYELGGGILFQSECNSSLFLKDIKSSRRSVNIGISTDEFNINIDESSSSSTIQAADNFWKHEIDSFSIPYQSKLTTELTESLLNTGKCELIDFDDSLKLHSILIKLFLNKFNERLEEQLDYCPIT